MLKVGNTWVFAGALKVGDKLAGYDGDEVEVKEIEEEPLESPENVYNLTIEDFHTYVVSEESVVVHNKCDLPKLKRVKRIDNISNDVLSNGPKWKSERLLQKHVKKRINKGHIPESWTAVEYNNRIKKVLESDNLEVYEYLYDEVTGEVFDQPYYIYGDKDWVVILGENGVMETAFPPDLKNGGYSGYLKTLKALKIK